MCLDKTLHIVGYIPWLFQGGSWFLWFGREPVP
jgi:hypothetical protein